MMLDLAFIAFVAAAALSAVGNSWPVALIAAGLALVVLNAHPNL